tara:strand:- start:126 stop:614 length:489 start_codon:yes stop_codon:yes gene_type:complete
MTSLYAYLNSPKTKKALSTKPGEEGFSLIELVIVVAVLAALSAIAIPAFVNISERAKATAAANTVATVAKECAVKYADNVTTPTFAAVNLQGYSAFTTGAANHAAAAGSAVNCITTGEIIAHSADEKALPSFAYNVATGEKSCDATAANPAASGRGCTNGKW